jgi:hypothetical protein
VANDPGGDRWVVLARRVVEALVAGIDQRSTPRSNTPKTGSRRQP